jgi:hypothetical protein
MTAKRKYAICINCSEFYNEEIELLGVKINRYKCGLEKEIYDEEYYVEREIPKNCLYSLENTVMIDEKLGNM